jgi:hypothetical protein
MGDSTQLLVMMFVGVTFLCAVPMLFEVLAAIFTNGLIVVSPILSVFLPRQVTMFIQLRHPTQLVSDIDTLATQQTNPLLTCILDNIAIGIRYCRIERSTTASISIFILSAPSCASRCPDGQRVRFRIS